MNRLLSKEMWMFLIMFFNSTKQIIRLRKEMNRLLIKRMSNIYLVNEKN